MSDLSAVAIFVKVVECSSFSQAARELELPKATVSRKVAALEASLGIALIHRTTRKLYLTEAGNLYFQRCRNVLSEISEADQAVASLQANPQGTLRITAPLIFGMTVLGEWVAEFLQQYDQVHMEVLLSNQSLDLKREGIDVAFRWQSDLSESFGEIQKTVKQVSYWACASPSYLQQYGEPNVPQDLVQHSCVVLSSQSHAGHANWQFTNLTKTIETVKVTGRLVVNDLILARQAAIAGAGIAYLPETIVSEAIEAGKLRRVLSIWGAKEKTLYVTRPNSLYLSSKARAFLDFVAGKSL
ncbi:LysR family transcriptional regulator [Phormidium tenue FACHB-886]|nr:LysR family transcriptional regulator [Phormidium tenue FACHB-886]